MCKSKATHFFRFDNTYIDLDGSNIEQHANILKTML